MTNLVESIKRKNMVVIYNCEHWTLRMRKDTHL